MGRLLLGLALAACLACGGSQKASRSDSALLFIKIAEPEASIWVDGTFVGEVSQAKGGVALEPGTHRIEIRHDRFHTHYREVTVTAKQRMTIDVELAEELP